MWEALGSLAGVFGQERANKQNKQLFRENQAWLERMSNTAHQRQVADLKEAGLNPVLSAKYGGASVPGSSAPNMMNSGKDVAANVNQSRAVTADNKLKGSQTAVNAEQISKIKADTQVSQHNARTAESNADINDLKLDMFRKHPQILGASLGGQVAGGVTGGLDKVLDALSTAYNDGPRGGFSPDRPAAAKRIIKKVRKKPKIKYQSRRVRRSR